MNEQHEHDALQEHDALHDKGANCAHKAARGRAFPRVNCTIFRFARSVFNTHAKQRALRIFDKGITAAQALLYAGGGLVLCGQPALLAAYIIIPAIVFCVGTALRAVINAPRPAETLDVTPLLSNDAAIDTASDATSGTTSTTSATSATSDTDTTDAANATTDTTRARIKRGKSFPGKHAFSAWSIAGISVCIALFTNAQHAPVMLVFALVESVIALVICVVRVLGVVHMIQDVIAGFALALGLEAVLCALWLTLF